MPDHTMNYIETEATIGLTLVEWRRNRMDARPRRRRIRFTPPRVRLAF